MTSTPRAIIQISTTGKNFSKVNYSRRMYAIVRRYTPSVSEGVANECFADLSGLRTFFKMTYAELAGKILIDLKREIGVAFTMRVGTVKEFEYAKNNNRKVRSISTYKELNKLFAGSSYVAMNNRKTVGGSRKKFTVPFLGKVA